ncbi:MAG: TetR family transcriptional regulator [Actinomycetota bacterium]|nr:TetR family transcriptional regulator [Actinomycetota bacterium]
MTESIRGAKKEATRAKLVEVAHQLFESKGYGDTNIREIAAAAGVSERTFYRYFETKDELLFPNLRGAIVDLLTNLRAAPDDISVIDSVIVAVKSSNVVAVPRMEEQSAISIGLSQGEAVINVVRLIVEFEFQFASEIARRISINNPNLNELDRTTYALVVARFIFNVFRSILNARERVFDDSSYELPPIPDHMIRVIKLIDPSLPPLT